MNRIYAFLLGLISAAMSAGCVIVALFALWNDYWYITAAGIVVALIVCQFTLLLYSRILQVNGPRWWSGAVYLVAGTLISFPLFQLLSLLVDTLFHNEIPVPLFWIVYGLLIGLVGMILLLGYSRFRRSPGPSGS
ncbi:MAG: hypothetical protein KDK25_12265 [Leptospiraceae bacterium]|nr:hypothetical protein [Leptospiraceae bacterium]